MNDETVQPNQASPAINVTRRAVVKTIAAAGAVAALGRTMGTPGVRAATSGGKITVGFDGGNDLLSGYVDQAVKAVKDAIPGAEIEVHKAPAGSFDAQLFLSLSTGSAPDVFLTNGVGIGELAAAGLVAPLDAYLAAWDGWKQYSDAVRGAISYQGKVWALPYAIDTHFIYYRKDLFAQAGLPREWQPKTPDDVLAAARAIKALGNDLIPYGLYAGANGGNGTAIRGLLPLLYAYGGSLTDASGKWIIDSCAIRDSLGYYQTAFQTDKTVPQEAMTAANPAQTMRAALGAGELGILFDGSWVYGGWAQDDPKTTSEQIGFVLHPAADGRPAFTVGGTGNTWYINARAQNKDLAWDFISRFNSPEAQVKLNSTDPHIPARMDAAADPAFQTAPFLSAMVASSAAQKFAAPDPSFRKLIGVIQNATGIVATGEAKPADAVTRYADEMTSILGAGRVVKQACG